MSHVICWKHFFKLVITLKWLHLPIGLFLQILTKLDYIYVFGFKFIYLFCCCYYCLDLEYQYICMTVSTFLFRRSSLPSYSCRVCSGVRYTQHWCKCRRDNSTFSKAGTREKNHTTCWWSVAFQVIHLLHVLS